MRVNPHLNIVQIEQSQNDRDLGQQKAIAAFFLDKSAKQDTDHLPKHEESQHLQHDDLPKAHHYHEKF